MYKRKTKDVWYLLGKYAYGWEVLFECEDGRDAREQLKCYNDNEIGIPHRIKKVREYIK